MEKAPLAERLAGIREAARRREEGIRQRIEWVEARQRELWSRQDRQPEPSTPIVLEEYAAAPRVQAAEPIRQLEVRGDERRHEARPPSLAPRPAEVLLARFRDILLQAKASVEPGSATDERATDTQQLVTAEP
jgi:hypothetical protein